MDVLITGEQFKNNCLKDDCIEGMKSLLNNVNTKHLFRNPVDEMLGSVPLKKPLKSFPTIKGQGYIDLESIVYKNF